MNKLSLNTKSLLIMGIINATPDSFSGDGIFKNNKFSLEKELDNMLKQSVDIIDVGGESTRPPSLYENVKEVTENEELDRVLPIIEFIKENFPLYISIDTKKPLVAKEAIKLGVSIVNDISGGHYDPKIIKIAGEKKAPYVLTYNEINPLIIDNDVNFKNIVQKALFYFSSKIKEGYKNGLNDIIIDPGFGFSKSIENDYFILKNLEFFKMLELPILVGLSRKSMIYKKLKISPEKGLNGTSILNSIALLKGANILRVHDVIEAKECIDLLQSL